MERTNELGKEVSRWIFDIGLVGGLALADGVTTLVNVVAGPTRARDPEALPGTAHLIPARARPGVTTRPRIVEDRDRSTDRPVSRPARREDAPRPAARDGSHPARPAPPLSAAV